MLQAIRSKASSFVVKLLFGLLIVTFGVWGIGDIFRNGDTDTSVAKVGDRAVTSDQVNNAVQAELQRMRGLFGGTLDLAQAKQLGIVDTALNQVVDADLVELEINRLGLAIGDEPVRDAIMASANFHDQAGKFDPKLYASILAANRLTQAQYEALLRTDILRAQLVTAITAGMTPPKVLADTLYRARAERRVADMVTLPPSAAGTVPTPGEQDITAFYQAHPEHFRSPELRSFKVATLRLDDVAAGITVTDDKLRQEYQARQDEFHTPEQRDLKQMLLPDSATAQKAEAELKGAKTFDAVAKDVANADAGSLDLGFMKQDDLPQDLAAAAFALKDGETTPPIQTAFGWHILQLVGIKPEETQSFDQVKDKLREEVAREIAGDQAAQSANQIDDALAGGATFEDLAQKFGMKTTTVAAVDSEGHGADGKTIDVPAPAATILKSAFDTSSGQTSSLEEMGDDGYYVVHVDAVTPAAVRPLAEVHDEAAKLWQDDARATALGKLADEIASEVKDGKSLKDVAAARKLAVTTTAPLPRTGGDATMPPALVAKLFDAKPNATATAPNGDSYVVAQLISVEAADPAKDEAAVKKLAQDITAAMQGDVLSQYTKALRQQFPVTVNQTNLDRLF